MGDLIEETLAAKQSDGANPEPMANGNGIASVAMQNRTATAPSTDAETSKIYLDLSAIPAEFKANGLHAVSMRIITNSQEMLQNGSSEASANQTFHPLFVYQIFEEPYDKTELALASEDNPEEEMAENGDEDGMEAEESDEEVDEVTRRGCPAPRNGSTAEDQENDEGLIVGYKDLSVKILFTPATLKPFVEIQYSDALPVAERSVPDLIKAVETVYGHKVMTTTEALQKAVSEDHKFVPFGAKLRTFTVTQKDNTRKYLELYEVGENSEHLGYPNGFAEYLANIQSFLPWFIYGASILTSDDPKWLHYFLYENVPEHGYRLVSYCSVYRYAVLPKKSSVEKWAGEFSVRCRIAQFVTLPTYQKHGFGARLLRGIIERLQGDPKTFDISVEDPDEQFSRLFNAVIARMLKDHLNRKSTPVDFKSYLSGMELSSLSRNLKLPKSVLRLAYDVVACNAAQLSGKEAAKTFHDQFVARYKRKLKAQKAALDTKLKRVNKGFYFFSDDDDEKSRMYLYSTWVYNIQKEIDRQGKGMEPEKVKEGVRSQTQIIQHAASRIDQLEF